MSCKECDKKITDDQFECLICDMTPLCEECYNEFHAECAEVDEEWDVDEDIEDFYS